MNQQDQLTYRRGANGALLGLIVQFILALGVALLGIYTQSRALYAATWYLFGGLPIWAVLWMVYNQHRHERAEALEAEQLAAADARTAALFDEAGQQLQLARKRLDNLYKYALPLVSLGLAAYLLAVGLTQFFVSLGMFNAGSLQASVMQPHAYKGIVVMALVGVSFAAFLVARYLAGMTEVRQWQLLRGGAGYLMGNAAVATALVLAGLLSLAGRDDALAVLALVVPALMALLGIEMLLAFVLTLYRPRRPGERARPAFDSRILGWLTRPESLGKIVSETLNYQFGFEISRSWFYRLLARAVTPLIVLGGVVLLAMSSLVIVAPQQNAVISTFGKLARVVTPGAHFKWPWPISTARTYDVYRVHQLEIGSFTHGVKPNTAILWTNQHAQGQEEYLLVGPTSISGVTDSNSIAAGLIGAEVIVKYRISDLKQYVMGVADPEKMLRDMAVQQMSRYFVTHDIDDLLARDRLAAGVALQHNIQQAVSQVTTGHGKGLGLEVVWVGMVGVHPPQQDQVAQKFHDQIGALQDKQTAIEKAKKEAVSVLAKAAGSRGAALEISDAIRTLDATQRQLTRLEATDKPDADRLKALRQRVAQQGEAVEKLVNAAGGSAAQMIYGARAYRWQVAIAELSRVERFAPKLAAYRAAPRYYMKRQYFETMAQGLADRRKVILTQKQTVPATIRIDLKTAQTSLDSILNTK